MFAESQGTVCISQVEMQIGSSMYLLVATQFNVCMVGAYLDLVDIADRMVKLNRTSLLKTSCTILHGRIGIKLR